MVVAEPRASVRVACRQLTKHDAEVKEIKSDDEEYDNNVSTNKVETTPDPRENEIQQVRLFKTDLLFPFSELLDFCHHLLGYQSRTLYIVFCLLQSWSQLEFQSLEFRLYDTCH